MTNSYGSIGDDGPFTPFYSIYNFDMLLNYQCIDRKFRLFMIICHGNACNIFVPEFT